MKPLLEITSTPISIEISVTRASFEKQENSPELPKMVMNKNSGGFEMSAEPAELKIDTYSARSSMGYGNYTDADMLKAKRDEGIKIAYEGTASVVDEGNSLEKGVTPAEIASQKMRAGFSIETVMEFLPKEGADITYNEGKLNINYEVDDLDLEWENLKKTPMKFIPGRIDVVVKSLPKVEIKYVGGPIYVPPSADPDYEPMFETDA